MATIVLSYELSASGQVILYNSKFITQDWFEPVPGLSPPFFSGARALVSVAAPAVAGSGDELTALPPPSTAAPPIAGAVSRSGCALDLASGSSDSEPSGPSVKYSFSPLPAEIRHALGRTSPARLSSFRPRRGPRHVCGSSEAAQLDLLAFVQREIMESKTVSTITSASRLFNRNASHFFNKFCWSSVSCLPTHHPAACLYFISA